MASAICAEPLAANTATILVSSAAGSADLQTSKHKRKKHKRVGQNPAALVASDSSSMCEAPDACWPGTSSGVAAPCTADGPAPQHLHREQDAPAAPQQQCQPTGQPQSPMQAAQGPRGSSRAAANGNSETADASSSASKGHASRPRRQGIGSPAHAAAAAGGNAGEADGDDAGDQGQDT